MPDTYNPTDWYWTVSGSATQVFSSSRTDYVAVDDGSYQAWVARGNLPTPIGSEAELGAVLAAYQIRPTPAAILDGYKESQATKLTIEIVAKVLFNHENRIRALEAKQPVTAAQFKSALKDLM